MTATEEDIVGRHRCKSLPVTIATEQDMLEVTTRSRRLPIHDCYGGGHAARHTS